MIILLTSELIGDKKEKDRSFQDDDRYFAQKCGSFGTGRFIMFSVPSRCLSS